MKFILNEKSILTEKVLLNERFILTEETLPEYKKKEAELRKAVEDKKVEINEILDAITRVLIGNTKPEDVIANTKEKIEKYEKPCKELVSSIDAFLQELSEGNLEISSQETATAVDNFLVIADGPVFPGGINAIKGDTPELDSNIEQAAKNIKKLIEALHKVMNSASNVEKKNDKAAGIAPKTFDSSDWTTFIEKATDKKAAWGAYYRSWDKAHGGAGTPDGMVYKRISGLGTAFMQGLDRLGYTKANPFIVYLDRVIQNCPINWQTYAVLHNAYVDNNIKDLTKQCLEGDFPREIDIAADPNWHKIEDVNIRQDYLLTTLNMLKNKEKTANKSITIDGLEVTEGDILGPKIAKILYNGDKLRPIKIVNQLADLFGAKAEAEAEISDAEAESFIDRFDGMSANDADAKDLAKLLIYNIARADKYGDLLAQHDLDKEENILKFTNPSKVSSNYNKIKDYANLGAQLDTILNSLVPVEKK